MTALLGFVPDFLSSLPDHLLHRRWALFQRDRRTVRGEELTARHEADPAPGCDPR